MPPVPGTTLRRFHDHRYAFLFYTLFLTIGATPVFRMLGLPGGLVDLLLALCLIEAILAVAPGRFQRVLLAVIGGVVVLRLAGRALGWGSLFEEATTATWTLAGIVAAAGALKAVFRRNAVHGETLYAALSAYLMVGLFLGILYGAIAARSPEAFLVLGQPASPANFAPSTGMYFSFVTLATLGYGDIVPAIDATRGLAVLETIGGQLYLAVLVARLVGMGGPRSS